MRLMRLMHMRLELCQPIQLLYYRVFQAKSWKFNPQQWNHLCHSQTSGDFPIRGHGHPSFHRGWYRHEYETHVLFPWFLVHLLFLLVKPCISPAGCPSARRHRLHRAAGPLRQAGRPGSAAETAGDHGTERGELYGAPWERWQLHHLPGIFEILF